MSKRALQVGDEAVVISDRYVSSGRTKGSRVRVLGMTRTYVRTTDEHAPDWNYGIDDLRPLTKLEKALK